MTGAGFGGCDPLLHIVPVPGGRSQRCLRWQGKVQEGLALAARQSLPKKPLVSGLGAPCHRSVPDHQQWGHERGLTTGDTRPWQLDEREAQGWQAQDRLHSCPPPCADDSTQTKYQVYCLESVVEKFISDLCQPQDKLKIIIKNSQLLPDYSSSKQ